MSTLQEILAAKAKQNMAKAQEAQGISVAAQQNIEIGAATSTAGTYGKMRSSPQVSSKELDMERAQNALAVYEDIKLRHIPRGRGPLFKAEAGYFYVENEADAQLISGYVGKRVPIIRPLSPDEFVSAVVEEKEES